MESSRQRTVGHLQGLYTVVVGLALAAALSALLDGGAGEPLNIAAVPYFIAFLVTMVPIYHGALRHLDIAYAESVDPPPPSAFMADWALLFLEGCGLLALALFVDRPLLFTWMLVLLLAFDALWAFAAHWAFARKQNVSAAELKWAVINVVTVVVLAVAIFVLSWPDPTASSVGGYWWLIIITITATRTIVDYWSSWSFYYPFGDRVD